MSKRVIAIMVAAVIALSITAVASDTDLETRVRELERKVAELEAKMFIMSHTEGNKESTETNEETFTLASGIYVVGEDIDPGTYSFKCIAGLNDIYIFNSYEDAVSEDHYFEYVFSYFLVSEDWLSSVGQISGIDYGNMSSDRADSVRLENGQVLRLDSSGTCEVTKKK